MALIGLSVAFALIHGNMILRMPVTMEEAVILYRGAMPVVALVPNFADMWVTAGDWVTPELWAQRLPFLVAGTVIGILTMRITWVIFRSYLAAALAGLWFNLSILGGLHAITISDAVPLTLFTTIAIWAVIEAQNAKGAASAWAVAALCLCLATLSDPRAALICIGLSIAIIASPHLRTQASRGMPWIAVAAPITLVIVQQSWSLPDPSAVQESAWKSLELFFGLTPGIAVIGLIALGFALWYGLVRKISQLLVALALLCPIIAIWVASGFDPSPAMMMVPLLVALSAGVAVTGFGPVQARFARMSSALATIIFAAAAGSAMFPQNPVSTRFPALDRTSGWTGLNAEISAEAQQFGADWLITFDAPLAARLAQEKGGIPVTTLRGDLSRRVVDCDSMGLFLSETDALEAVQTQFDGVTPLRQIARNATGGTAQEYHLFAVGRPIDTSLCNRSIAQVILN